MRAVVALTLAAAACASVSARENDKATPGARDVEDDQPARLPDAPADVDVGVGQDGTVTSAVVMGALANTPVGNCVSAAARTATFPPSLGGSFEYPFGLK